MILGILLLVVAGLTAISTIYNIATLRDPYQRVGVVCVNSFAITVMVLAAIELL